LARAEGGSPSCSGEDPFQRALETQPRARPARLVLGWRCWLWSRARVEVDGSILENHPDLRRSDDAGVYWPTRSLRRGAARQLGHGELRWW
jgi:hypothetical protein